MTIWIPSGSKNNESLSQETEISVFQHSSSEFLCFRYARLYLAIQFFDPDSLLPPPFTFLTLIMYLIRSVAKSKCLANNKNSTTHKETIRKNFI